VVIGLWRAGRALSEIAFILSVCCSQTLTSSSEQKIDTQFDPKRPLMDEKCQIHNNRHFEYSKSTEEAITDVDHNLATVQNGE